MVKPLIILSFCSVSMLTCSSSQPAHAGYVEECYGCHSAKRMKPIDGLFPNGFGHWRDSQCYGCHREINDIALNVSNNIFDKRLFALPVSKQRLKQLIQYPLSYMHAPKNIIFSINGIPRYDSNRLLRFLRQPVSLNKIKIPYTSMLAYPSLNQKELGKVIKTLNNNQPLPESSFNLIKKNTAQATKIWNQQCKNCHETSMTPYDKQGLSLFSADWIYNYVNGFIQVPGKKRNMPVLNIDKATAKGLKSSFSYVYETAQHSLTKAIQKIPNKPIKQSQKINEKAVNYIWNRFFRDGMCVHCHGIEGRAKQHFDTSSQASISNWLKENSPWKIWRRLETRAYEIKSGIQAPTPGMPMAAPALPKPMRELFATWAHHDCPDLSGKNHCDGNM